MPRKTKIPAKVTATIKDVPFEYRQLFNQLCDSIKFTGKSKAEVFSEIVYAAAVQAFSEVSAKGRLETSRGYRNVINSEVEGPEPDASLK